MTAWWLLLRPLMRNPDIESSRPRSILVPATVAVLVFVGVGAALARYLLPHALHLTLTRPLYGGYATDQLPVLAAHPVSEALHRLGGAVYMILGLLQFSPRLRAERPRLHRVTGRVFLLMTLVAGGSGVYMGLSFPYQSGERLPSALFGSLMVVFALIAFVYILRRDVTAHREWMMRSFAVGLGIGTIRVIAVILLNTTSLEAKELIVPVFWVGWTLTVIAAEIGIRLARAGRESAALPPSRDAQLA